MIDGVRGERVVDDPIRVTRASLEFASLHGVCRISVLGDPGLAFTGGIGLEAPWLRVTAILCGFLLIKGAADYRLVRFSHLLPWEAPLLTFFSSFFGLLRRLYNFGFLLLAWVRCYCVDAYIFRRCQSYSASGRYLLRCHRAACHMLTWGF